MWSPWSVTSLLTSCLLDLVPFATIASNGVFWLYLLIFKMHLATHCMSAIILAPQGTSNRHLIDRVWWEPIKRWQTLQFCSWSTCWTFVLTLLFKTYHFHKILCKISLTHGRSSNQAVQHLTCVKKRQIHTVWTTADLCLCGWLARLQSCCAS